jgi:hypothetical protein
VVEPRLAIIDGRRVAVFERTPPLPPTLVLLLNGGRDPAGRVWQALRVSMRRPLTLAGARSACLSEDHRMVPWLDGFHVGSDTVTRSIHLDACADCGSVRVNDTSFDTLDRIDPGRGEARPAGRPPLRKNHVIGWYTGARPNGREYR